MLECGKVRRQSLCEADGCPCQLHKATGSIVSAAHCAPFVPPTEPQKSSCQRREGDERAHSHGVLFLMSVDHIPLVLDISFRRLSTASICSIT